MKKNGFTVVELLITITIVGILLVLGVANLNASQANARDSERKSDVESLTFHLDAFYSSGHDTSPTIGRYPSTAFITTTSNVKKYLRDLDLKSIQAPRISDPMQTFIKATNNNQTVDGVAPSPTINQYVYQPIKSDGNLCTLETEECRKFNIYYRTEVDNQVHMMTGKNQ